MNLVEEIEEDFLTVDDKIPGQNFVCLSFVSPEKIIKNKEMFMLKEFVNDLNKELKWDYDNIAGKYEDFRYRREKELIEQFNEENNFQTSMRGIKCKGTYDTLKEAQVKAKKFQRQDPQFHVFVGQVGYWLPWDPTNINLDSIEQQEYSEKELNKLIHGYKENEVQKDIHYQEMLQQKLKDSVVKKLEEKDDPWIEQKKIEGSPADTPPVEADTPPVEADAPAENSEDTLSDAIYGQQ